MALKKEQRWTANYRRLRQKRQLNVDFAETSYIIFVINQKLYPIEIKKGVGKDRADKNFKILEQYKMPIATGLIIDTSDRVFPLNKDAYYCPVGMIGL